MKASELRPGQPQQKVTVSLMDDSIIINCEDNQHARKVLAYLEPLAVAGWDDETSCGVVTLSVPDKLFRRDVTGLNGLHDESDVVEPEPLQLAEGKWYCTENGNVFGPLARYNSPLARYNSLTNKIRWHIETNDECLWRGDGTEVYGSNHLIREVPPPASVGTQPHTTAGLPTNCKAELTLEGAQNFTNNGCNSLLGQKRQDDEGWIENTGVRFIADDVRIEVKYRSGSIGKMYARDAHWDIQEQYDDITHYRVVEQPKPTYRPFANADEFKPHCHRVLRSTYVANHYLIASWFNDSGCARDGVTYKQLLEHYVFDDNNEPCGVRE